MLVGAPAQGRQDLLMDTWSGRIDYDEVEALALNPHSAQDVLYFPGNERTVLDDIALGI